MKTKEEIIKLREYHDSEMRRYSTNTTEHTDRYGHKPCDYLSHQVTMANYHRGAVNIIIEILK